MKTKKKQGMRFSAKEAFAFSEKSFATLTQPKPVLHVSCHGVLEIEHCKKIIHYTAQSIRLDMGVLVISIEGDSLVMDVFRKDFIKIHGHVFAIKFCYEKG